MQCLNCNSFKIAFINPPKKVKFLCILADESFHHFEQGKPIVLDMAICRECGFVEFFCNAFTNQPININQIFRSS